MCTQECLQPNGEKKVKKNKTTLEEKLHCKPDRLRGLKTETELSKNIYRKILAATRFDILFWHYSLSNIDEIHSKDLKLI